MMTHTLCNSILAVMSSALPPDQIAQLLAYCAVIAGASIVCAYNVALGAIWIMLHGSPHYLIVLMHIAAILWDIQGLCTAI